MKDRVSNGRMCCKEPLMLRSGRLQSRQVAGRARGAGLPAPGLAEGRAHCGANRVGACCGEGQGAEQAHLAGEEGRSSRSPMDQKTYNNRSGSRSGGWVSSQRARRLLMRYVAVTPVRLNGPACWHALRERSSQPAGLTHPQRARRPHMMSMKADGPRNDCGAYVAQADFVRTAVGKATRRGPQQASVPR